MKFEWDDDKADANIVAHGISFEDARWVFTDPLAVEDYDEAHSTEEERFERIGMAQGKLITVIYTMRSAEWEEETYRLISAWPATSEERKLYEEGE
ncbi:MAG: BrnT family toxin [Pyrinomonadaceae bacterium]